MIIKVTLSEIFLIKVFIRTPSCNAHGDQLNLVNTMYEFVDITFMKKVKKSVNVAYNLLSVNEHSLLNYICSKFNSRKERSLVFIETITNICESKFTMILIVAIFIRIICNYLYTHYIKFYRLWALCTVSQLVQ